MIALQKYTFYEVANLLNVSHQTIYNRVKNKDIYKQVKPFIKNEGKHRYITSDGVDVLKKFIKIDKNFDNDFDNEEVSNNDNSVDNDRLGGCKINIDNEVNNELINVLKSQIDSLQEQLKIKDEHINNKDNQIDALIKINENNQVLLRDSQKKVELLEERNTTTKKSFWSRLWK